MGRRAKYHWDGAVQAYRTDAGGATRYFRGIARDDHAGIATAFAAFMVARVEAAKPPEPDFFDLCEAFKIAPRGIEARTVRAHKERLTKFCRWSPSGRPEDMIGGRKASDLKASDLKAALRQFEKDGLSDHYRAGVCRSVKAATAWGASEEGGRLIPSDPFAETRPPKVARSPERYGTNKEVADFLRFAWRRLGASPGAMARRAASLRWREAAGLHAPAAVVTPAFGPLYQRFGRLLVLMIRVGSHTGARPGDLCSAWWRDFDAEKSTITLPADRHKTGSKTGRPLVLFLPPAIVRALRRERDRPGRHPVSIFTHKRGKGAATRGEDAIAGVPWGKFVDKPGGQGFIDDSTPLSQAIRKIRVAAVAWQTSQRAEAIARGVPEQLAPPITIRDRGPNRFVFYLLRHTRASDYVMRGGHSATVAELLGTSPRMLETTYGHVLEDHKSREAARLRTRPGRRGDAG